MRTACMAFVAWGLLLTGPLQAVPVEGTLNITGSVSISSQGLDFLPAAGGTGSVLADVFSQTGSFVPFAGTTGTIQDLNPANTSVGTPFSLSSFVVLAASPTTQINLTRVDPGVFSSALFFAPPAAGQIATPPIGLGGFHTMYNMVNLSGSSSIFSFAVAGNVVNLATAEVSPMTGVFTLQFPSHSYQQVWATLTPGGSLNTSFSASLVAVPEPATLLLLGSTLLLAGLRRGRNRA